MVILIRELPSTWVRRIPPAGAKTSTGIYNYPRFVYEINEVEHLEGK